MTTFRRDGLLAPLGATALAALPNRWAAAQGAATAPAAVRTVRS